MITEQQRQLRTQGIGGSDAAAACGVSPYRSRYDLWHEKTHGTQVEATLPMRFGAFAESFIREEYERMTGREVMQPGMLRHPEHPWMLANIDGVSGERLLEAKTVGMRGMHLWGEPGTDEVPDDYRFQVQHYLAVTGLPVCDVAVLIAGGEVALYEVAADQELQASIITLEADLWRRVQENDPPEPESGSDALRRWPTNTVPDMPEASTELLDTIADLRESKEEAGALAKHIDTLEAKIKSAIGEHDGIKHGDQILATWKCSKATERLDATLLKKERPEIFSEYSRESEGSRRFLLKTPSKKKVKK